MEAVLSNSREGGLRDWLGGYFKAIGRSDLEAIASHFDPEIVAYDAIERLEFRGAEAYRAHWRNCLAHCQSMIFEPQEPTILIDGDLAAIHALIRCGGVDLQGVEHSGWMRGTIVARRTDGRWRIVHEHYSSPFDPMSGKVLDVKPQAD